MILAPERMIRMDLLTLRADAERLTSLLAIEGTVHVVERDIPTAGAKVPPGVSPEHPARREKINSLTNMATALLQRLELAPLDIADTRRETFVGTNTDDVVAEAAKTLGALNLAIDEHLRRSHEVEASIAGLNELSEEMHLLDDHGLSFLDLQGFAHFHAVCGTMDRSQAARLTAQLRSEPCALVTRPAYGKDAAFLLIGDRERKDEIDAMLKDAGAHRLVPPDRFIRSFEDGLEQVEIELWEARDRLAELAREFEQSRAQWHEILSEWVARLQVHGLLDEALSRFGSDGTVTFVSGFVPVSKRQALVARLEREAGGIYFARFDAAEQARKAPVPTLLRNLKLFRPFELFVKTYGLPGYNDVDPTALVAISFLAMFGMMFGDVGHGLVLAAIGAGMAFLPYRAFLALRELGRILMMAGLSGTFFGFLFGSVFGIEKDSFLPALWMRPNHPENLTLFLGVAVGMGVLVLSTGIILSIVQSLRQGNIRKAVLGQWSAASLVFFWSFLVLFALRMLGKEVSVPPGLTATALAAPLCLIAGGQIAFLARDRRRRAKKPENEGHEEDEEAEEYATILFEPIEIIMNLFANSVSFMRVAAFGLAHAALTMATFVIRDMVRAPGADVVSMPVEHLFIIVLEGMIVTIQCLRLEYYEFFSKFFVGNGAAYAPLTIRAKGNTE